MSPTAAQTQLFQSNSIPLPCAHAFATKSKDQAREICSGTRLTSPGGRLLRVRDVFVPKSNSEKSKTLPAQFRHLARKIVVFDNGSIAPLSEVQNFYRL